VTRLRQLGQDVTLREFRGIHHSFDALSVTQFTPGMVPGWPTGGTLAACFFVELPDGRLVNQETGQEFTFDDPCVRFDGVNLGNPTARTLALEELTIFFRAIFHL
jgi:hypothetical protein